MTKPLYLPNGSAGMDFMAMFCDRCQCEPDTGEEATAESGCPILSNAMFFSVGEEGYPKEWVEDDDGSNPRCTAFVERTEPFSEPLDPYAIAKAKAAYDALPRYPVTGRPIIS